MKLSRRGFVKFSAGSVAGLGLAGLTLRGLSEANAILTEELYPPRGPESFANTLCQLCPGGCGITVRKIGSRAVRVQGNKNSPVNGNGLCPVGVASLQYLYHPQRLQWPLKKQGNSWTRIPWDQALNEIALRLRALGTGGGAERVVVMSQPLTGVLKQNVRNLLKGLGSRNLIELSGPADGIEVALRLMQGATERPAYDLAHSNYVLSIGCDFLEGWTSPVWAMKSFSQFRGKRPRGRLVYAGSRQSVTASKADTWIRIPPGTEGAFALGIAYALISERLYDFEFVRSQCFGFDDWRGPDGSLHVGFRNMVLDNYPLNRVSELTGAPPEQILRVAREFAANRPALALVGSIETVTPDSVFAALCVHSLNGLMGNIDREGGVLLQYPGLLDVSDKTASDESPALAGWKERGQLGEDPLHLFERALRQKDPFVPSALILLEADPVFDSDDGESLSKRLAKVPLIVSVSSFLDSTSQLAHYVLPAATFFESWVEQSAPPGVPFLYQGLTQPVIEPLGESRSCGDAVLGLMRALHVGVPEGDYGIQVKSRLARLYEQKRGAVAGTVFDQMWQQLMEQSGWWAPTYETSDQLLEQMASKGGWWDSFYHYEDWQRTLRTNSGKFQFYVPGMDLLQDSKTAAGDAFRLLHFESFTGKNPDDKYPFRVIFFDPLAAIARQPALPFLREIAGGHMENHVGVWAEIADVDALRLGLRSGDLVWIESQKARIQAFARVSSSVPLGVVGIPRTVGGKTTDPWSLASTPGGTVLVDQPADGDAGPLWKDTRVRVSRA